MAKKNRGRGAERDRDGLPVPDHPLSPNQRAIRNVVLRSFSGNVQALADAMQTDPPKIYKWINGISEPNRDSLRHVAEVAGVAIGDLWVPEPDAIYFRGAVIRNSGKTKALYEELCRYAEPAVRHHAPSLARRLGL